MNPVNLITPSKWSIYWNIGRHVKYASWFSFTRKEIKSRINRILRYYLLENTLNQCYNELNN